MNCDHFDLKSDQFIKMDQSYLCFIKITHLMNSVMYIQNTNSQLTINFVRLVHFLDSFWVVFN